MHSNPVDKNACVRDERGTRASVVCFFKSVLTSLMPRFRGEIFNFYEPTNGIVADFLSTIPT